MDILIELQVALDEVQALQFGEHQAPTTSDAIASVERKIRHVVAFLRVEQKLEDVERAAWRETWNG